ncbi:MAG: phenylacetate--CoA ligase [Deltaproteobacteria bacterium]|nr:phenylacetate--CoA ligase [Deltaproteobacteria bacterium]
MSKTFMPSYSNISELKNHQLEGLKWTVRHAYTRSEHYRRAMEEVGIKPENIQSLDDIQKLPFTTVNDLKSGYPFPLLSVPMSDVARIHASSGTTGKRKILAYTQKDIDDWATCFARCYEMAGLSVMDRVQIAVGYGVWTAGVGFQLGCELFGAMAVPLGPGNIDLQCEFLIDLQPTVLCCTASMGLLMAEEIKRRGIRDKIALKKMIFGSERSSEAMRQHICDLIGLEELFDIVGMTELYGPGTGIDCPRHEGIHYWADYYILEVLDPDTLKPVAPGEIGEMVVTTLKKEAVPLIRYRTRDLTRLIEHSCSCGNIMPMHDRILGRSDDMIIFRAVNIYPGQIDSALSTIDEIGSEYQIILGHGDDGRDYMTLRVESREGLEKVNHSEIEGKVSTLIKKSLLVSCNVEATSYGSLPRSERKSKRVFDNRMS